MTMRIGAGVVCSGLAAVALVVGLAGGIPSCVEAGALDNEEQTGWQERGRDPGEYYVDQTWDANEGQYNWDYHLVYNDIMLSPDGGSLLAMVPVPGPNQGYAEPGMVLVARSLESGVQKVFPEMKNLVRVNFSPDGRLAYLLQEGGQEVAALDLATMTVVRSYVLEGAFGVIDVTPDGEHLVLSNLPKTDAEEIMYGGHATDCATTSGLVGLPPGAKACEVELVEVATGKVTVLPLELRPRDIDFSTVYGDLLITYSRWDWVGEGQQVPHATVLFVEPASGLTVAAAEFANCADELVVDPMGDLGLVAPTSCRKDPISVIDLKTRSFVKNLPGFGPVVVSRDGSAAVGFTRKETMAAEWDYVDQQLPVGLIVVNLKDLSWRIVEYGDAPPAYTMTPDGRFLYVYHDEEEWVETKPGQWELKAAGSGLTRVDIATLSRMPVTSAALRFDRFVWTPDGTEMYFLSEGRLNKLAAGGAMVQEVPLAVTPELLNIRPQGDYVVLGEWDAPIFYLMATGGEAPLQTLTLTL